jgi:signal transduction histidine kinase
MSDTEVTPEKRMVLVRQPVGSTRQPVELYHLSHDLRGPLNSILGFSELLLEGVEGPLTEYQEVDITAIHQSAQNLLRLINTVVDLSKLEADRLKFDLTEVDINDLIQKVAAFDFGGNKPDSVDLVAQAPAGLPLIWGDRERVEQMVLSLVRFAFKKKKSGQVFITAASVDQTVIIRVSFSEVELAPAELADLFELVVHVDQAGRSELGPGGLELPLVWGLAEKHNGRIWVESNRDQGTTLSLQLPISGHK